MNFSDKRLRYAVVLQFLAITSLTVNASYVTYSLLSEYPIQMLPYYFFLQAIGVIIVFAISQRAMQAHLHKYTFLFYCISICLSLLFYIFSKFNYPWTAFLGTIVLSIIQMQNQSVVTNTISTSFDSREFRSSAKKIIIASSIGGMFSGLSVPIYINFVGNDSLLLLLIGLFLLQLLISWNLEPLREPVGTQKNLLKSTQSKFVRFLFLYAIAIMTIYTLFDYIFKYSLAASFDSKYYGMIVSFILGAIFCMVGVTQLLGQKWLINSIGVANILIILPVSTLLFALTLLLSPSFVLSAVAISILMVILNSYNYVAYNLLLNSLPVNSRVVALTLLNTVARAVGAAFFAAVVLWLLGTYATIPIVASIVVVLSVLCIFLIMPIQMEYRKTLKNVVEKSNYKIYEYAVSENVFTTLPINNVQELIAHIGRDISIFEALTRFKKIEENPLPILLGSINASSHMVVNKYIAILCLLNEEGVELAMMKLLDNPTITIQNAIAKYSALRALKHKPGAQLIHEIKKKLLSDSEYIQDLEAILNKTDNVSLHNEIKSRLYLAKKRFIYWLAVISETAAILKAMPSIMGGTFYVEQLQKARAIDYLESLLSSAELRTLVDNTFESERPVLPENKALQIINKDPWLSRVYEYINNKERGNKVYNEEKVFLLREQSLFSKLPAEILNLIAVQLKEHALKQEDILFKEGDMSDRVYIIYSGEIILIRDNKPFKTIAHTVFGELGLIDNAPRAATAMAKSDCVLFSLDIQEFNQLLDEIPLMSRAIIHQLLSYYRDKLINDYGRI